MIDMHTHILYGIDDGAGDFMLALDMLGEEWKQGVRGVVMTPHYGPKFQCPLKEFLEERFQKLCDKAYGKYPDMRLYLGNEAYYHENLISDLQEGRVLTMNHTQYVLVEFSFGESYSTIKYAVGELVYAGYIPIIAHIERYRSMLGKYDEVQELIDTGAYIQVNVESFLGGIFSKRTVFVKKLAKMNLIDFVASDCHDLIDRRPNLQSGKKIIEKQTDFSKFTENAEKMLRGDYI